MAMTTLSRISVMLAVAALFACDPLLAQSRQNNRPAEETADAEAEAPAEEQNSAATLAISELQAQLELLVSQGKFYEALPLLEEMARIAESDPDLTDVLQSVYYFSALGNLQAYAEGDREGTLDAAMDWLNKYIERFPDGDNIVPVLMRRGDIYRGMTAQQETNEGKLEMLKKSADDFAKVLRPPYNQSLRTPERIEALLKASEAYYYTKQWETGLPFFQRLLELARDEEDQAFAASAVMESLLQQDRFDEALAMLRFLTGDSPARYSLQFNLAMLQGADALSSEERERYSDAALLYALVKTVPEIKDYYTKRLERQQQELALLQRRYPEGNERIDTMKTDVEQTQNQLNAVNQLIEKDQGYTAELKVRIASNYQKAGRPFEAFWGFLRVVEEHEDHPQAAQFIYTAFSLAIQTQVESQIEALGETYIDDPRLAEYRSDIALLLANFYRDQEQWQKLADFGTVFLREDSDSSYARQMVYYIGSGLVGANDLLNLELKFTSLIEEYPQAQMADGLYYWRGMARMLSENYSGALDDFESLLAFYAANPSLAASYKEDAQYRKAVCLYGMENFVQARDDLEQFVENNPGSELLGEAFFFLGDVNAILNNNEDALGFYLQVEDYTDNIEFIRDAFLQSAQVLEITERWDEMESTLVTFINKYGERIDVSDALAQLGKARAKQNKMAAMAEAYQAAIDLYGDQKQSLGVDQALREYPRFYYSQKEALQENIDFFTKMQEDKAFRETLAEDRSLLFRTFMESPTLDKEIGQKLQYDKPFSVALVEDPAPIQEWIDRYQSRLDAFPDDTPESYFESKYTAAKAADGQILRLRMIMALENLDASPEPDYIPTENQLQLASPALLLWMAQKLEESSPTLSRTAYTKVVEDYPTANERLDAMLALAEMERALGNTDAALEWYKQAEENFAGTERGARIVLDYANLLRESGDYKEAVGKYVFVTQNPDWRGEPSAEALYGLGLIEFEQENFQAAYRMFERVYISQQFYVEWAARSYLKAAEALIRDGQRPRAQEVLAEAMTELPEIETTSAYDEIQRLRNTL